MVHNHPSGNLIPSDADRQLHNKLSIAGDGIGVNIMPSIIINLDSGKYTEFEQYDITTSDNKEVKGPDKTTKGLSI